MVRTTVRLHFPSSEGTAGFKTSLNLGYSHVHSASPRSQVLWRNIDLHPTWRSATLLVQHRVMMHSNGCIPSPGRDQNVCPPTQIQGIPSLRAWGTNLCEAVLLGGKWTCEDRKITARYMYLYKAHRPVDRGTHLL